MRRRTRRIFIFSLNINNISSKSIFCGIWGDNNKCLDIIILANDFSSKFSSCAECHNHITIMSADTFIFKIVFRNVFRLVIRAFEHEGADFAD